mmetsp:Transcript_21943/g.68649  ORF Transcript_21943/g.68649 Transcript_21943/m.68649 type:complete len:228 (+) Transcript_21943:1168-1851(+)
MREPAVDVNLPPLRVALHLPRRATVDATLCHRLQINLVDVLGLVFFRRIGIPKVRKHDATRQSRRQLRRRHTCLHRCCGVPSCVDLSTTFAPAPMFVREFCLVESTVLLPRAIVILILPIVNLEDGAMLAIERIDEWHRRVVAADRPAIPGVRLESRVMSFHLGIFFNAVSDTVVEDDLVVVMLRCRWRWPLEHVANDHKEDHDKAYTHDDSEPQVRETVILPGRAR